MRPVGIWFFGSAATITVSVTSFLLMWVMPGHTHAGSVIHLHTLPLTLGDVMTPLKPPGFTVSAPPPSEENCAGCKWRVYVEEINLTICILYFFAFWGPPDGFQPGGTKQYVCESFVDFTPAPNTGLGFSDMEWGEA